MEFNSGLGFRNIESKQNFSNLEDWKNYKNMFYNK